MRPVIRLFFKTVRLVLTPFMLLFDRVTEPRAPQRPEVEQRRLDAQTRGMVLYHFRTCPFCIRTRHAIRRLGLNIELRDAQHNAANREALRQGGGKVQVPCLQVTGEGGQSRWIYESSAIIAFLEQRFGEAAVASSAAGDGETSL